MLAPMAGITSLAYRDFMKPFGVACSVTEMVSDCGLIYNNQQTLDYLKTSSIDHPIGLQLFGSDENKIIAAMDIAESYHPHFDFYDINLGCPVNKVTSTGAGSAMLKDTTKLFNFMKKIVEHASKPVTAKIRLGWNDESINFYENIKALEAAGVVAIGIHARTREQLYSGKARYDLLKDLRDKMNVPLIVSGDIYSLDDAINALEITKADAVMVARGGVGNPFLVKQIDQYFKDKTRLPDPTLRENINYLLQLTDMMIEEKGEKRAIMIMRGIAPKFLNNYPNCKKIKHEICETISSKESLVNILKAHQLL